MDNSDIKIKKKKKKDRRRELSPIYQSTQDEYEEPEIISPPKKKRKSKINDEELDQHDKTVLMSPSNNSLRKQAQSDEDKCQTSFKKKRSKHKHETTISNKAEISHQTGEEEEIQNEEAAAEQVQEPEQLIAPRDPDDTLDDQHTEVLEILSMEEEIKEPQDFFDGWNKEDIKELFRRMEAAIPKNDTLKYNSRVAKLDWEKIKFNSYSATDCCERWKVIEKKLRGYRILNEILVDAHAWAEKPWTDFYRSVKKNRHPDQPKRPLTSYMLYYMEKKKKFAKKYPQMEMNKLAKIVAAKFNSLPEETKNKYNKAAADLRENYNSKMEAFLKQHPEEAKLLKKQPKKNLAGGRSGPKKPLPPFKIFYQDKLKQLDGIGNETEPAVILSQCKEKWKNMSNRKKISWIRWAHEAEEKYLEEIKLYTCENPNFEAPPYKSVLSKKEKDILKKMEGKPEKPPNSAYSLFSRLMLRERSLKEKFETPKERMQEIAKLWKELPKVEKEEYAEKVKHLIENYKLEYATYLDSLPEDKRSEELASSLPKKKVKSDSTPSKKLKQTTILAFKNLMPQAQDPKKSKSLDELLQLEPVHPPDDAFILLRDEYITKGLSEKKAVKAWSILSKVEKRKYQEKLEKLKQEYITNFRAFLTSLKPEELNIYSAYKGKKKEEVGNTSENEVESVEAVESQSDSGDEESSSDSD